MKNRNIPFGYQYQNGVVTLHPIEEQVLRQIARDYLAGQSLLKIAEGLNANQVEYQPGIIGWNKARIMRLLEDKRYLGDGGYPAIIDADTFASIQIKKYNRNKLKNIDRQSDIFQITVPVLCPDCGTEMHRRHDSRCKCTERWFCRNKDCKTLIKLSDHDLLSQITAILNQLVVHPERIKGDKLQELAPTTEQRRLDNEIGRMIDTKVHEKETLQKKMLEMVSLKYKLIPSTVGTAYRLKADFEQSGPLSVFSAELFGNTVNAIYLNRDSTIELKLLNGQRIGKE